MLPDWRVCVKSHVGDSASKLVELAGKSLLLHFLDRGGGLIYAVYTRGKWPTFVVVSHLKRRRTEEEPHHVEDNMHCRTLGRGSHFRLRPYC